MGSKNKEQVWKIGIYPVDATPHWDIVTTHGQVDGKQQVSRVTIQQGKNIGRANETTPRQQAESEAESKWKKQLDKCYSEQRGGASKVNKPMLAHKYHEHAGKVDFTSAWIQPKLDGNRCIAARVGDEITLTSRGSKPITTMGHIIDELRLLMQDGDVIDGELYKHGVELRQIRSLITRAQEDSATLEYHVYDVISSETFQERFANFQGRFYDVMSAKILESIKLVPTQLVTSMQEVWEQHTHFTSNGYEGVMVRHSGCPYEDDKRSSNLLKVKKFTDEEFEIVDVVPDGVARPTHAKFVCKSNSSDATFFVVPEGPHSVKEEYLRERASLIGKKLTVRYFEMTTTENPVPLYACGVAVREDHE